MESTEEKKAEEQPTGPDEKGFYAYMTGLCAEHKVAFTDKEMFILKAPVQVHQAIIALQVYSL